MLTLIENGFVYAPEPRGVQSVLLAGDRIEKIGDVDRRALESVGLDIDVVDAGDCLVIPGLIDPHEHLLGGSGEEGFSSQTPEIFLREIAIAGVTTVVGCLGVVTTTKTMPWPAVLASSSSSCLRRGSRRRRRCQACWPLAQAS